MRTALAFIALVLPLAAHAQTIDKIKLTDSELTCTQIYAEIGEMDTIMGVSKESRDSSATAATTAGMTQQATGVAVHAAAMSGSLGAAVGLAQAAPLLGLFGSATKSVAEAKEKESGERMGEAKARKEHLTGLFVGKGCKVSEMKSAAATVPPSQSN
ncbi:MAG: hypothetical protein K9J42_04920 [Sulfuritalea sp.]|nr:hypothetical protein [Sulfuritalea sp.]